MPQSVVQALVGHGSPAMTRHYLGHAPQLAGALPVASGSNLDAMTAMLDGLKLDELEVVSAKVRELITAKRVLPVAVK